MQTAIGECIIVVQCNFLFSQLEKIEKYLLGIILTAYSEFLPSGTLF